MTFTYLSLRRRVNHSFDFVSKVPRLPQVCGNMFLPTTNARLDLMLVLDLNFK